MSANRKRVSALRFARSLRRKTVGDLRRIAIAQAHDERALWAVLDTLDRRPGNDAVTLKQQIRERLIFGKPLPKSASGAAIWSTAIPRPSARSRYAVAGYIVLAALMIAAGRITEADARLLDIVVGGVQMLGTYLSG